MAYKYFIDRVTDGYQFALYPNNNNRQSIIFSVPYPTVTACREALEEFRVVVSRSRMVGENSIVIEKGDFSVFFVVNKEGKYLATSHRYGNLSLCKDGVQRLLNHYSDPLKDR